MGLGLTVIGLTELGLKELGLTGLSRPVGYNRFSILPTLTVIPVPQFSSVCILAIRLAGL